MKIINETVKVKGWKSGDYFLYNGELRLIVQLHANEFVVIVPTTGRQAASLVDISADGLMRRSYNENTIQKVKINEIRLEEVL